MRLPSAPHKGWLRSLSAEEYEAILASPQEANDNDDNEDDSPLGSGARGDSDESAHNKTHVASDITTPAPLEREPCLTLPKNKLKDEGRLFASLHSEIAAN